MKDELDEIVADLMLGENQDTEATPSEVVVPKDKHTRICPACRITLDRHITDCPFCGSALPVKELTKTKLGEPSPSS